MGRRGPLGRSGRGVAVLLAGALAVVGAACTSQRTATPGVGGKADGRTRIGLVTKTDSNPFFVALREAAKARAAADGAELVALAGKFDGDNDGQVAALENLVQQGVDAILVTPNNSSGILGAIRHARDRGILVVALDTETSPRDAVDATFATDNVEAGRSQGRYVRAALAERDPRLLMLDGTPGGTVDEQRHRGFLDGFGLGENDPRVLGRQPTNGDQSRAQQAMENLLQRANGVNAVYTLNEPAARGAHSALQARGVAGQVVVGSVDGGCQGVRDVREGRYAVTVMQFPRRMAEEGVRAAVEFTRTGTRPSGFVDTGSAVVTDRPVPGVDSRDTAWALANCWG
ncbi:substrate-binding domain-containing protein [Streptoalloteichus hindustanus]|uniref:Fructose transport system substrate-binding protein n=1 Tax=Streptoalloteichus hindustanus TaxID=2017 RepID=A0A1M4UHT1_STRHI|nr:substrate-binding domain-containing protein [Streptoalloteichus hindustanus]SHE56214.1 fructose transport system substrate-binding protein [Streptoalloteichus hindustanus]